MKTQINNLRSGSKNQLLNENVDYSKLNKATSHVGHAGSSNAECSLIWEKIKSENPIELKVLIFEKELVLKGNWSVSGKSVSFFTTLTDDVFSLFPIESAKGKNPTLQVDFSNIIVVSNGKNSSMNICPSLITIL